MESSTLTAQVSSQPPRQAPASSCEGRVSFRCCTSSQPPSRVCWAGHFLLTLGSTGSTGRGGCRAGGAKGCAWDEGGCTLSCTKCLRSHFWLQQFQVFSFSYSRQICQCVVTNFSLLSILVFILVVYLLVYAFPIFLCTVWFLIWKDIFFLEVFVYSYTFSSVLLLLFEVWYVMILFHFLKTFCNFFLFLTHNE